MLKWLAGRIFHRNNNPSDLRHNIDQYYIYILDIIDSKLYRPKKTNKYPPLKNILIINFQNKATEYIKLSKILNPKKAGARVNLTPPYDLSKSVFSRDRVKTCFFVNFNIIISHIFSETLSSRSRFSPSILIIFIDFSEFLAFSCCKETNEVSI